MTTLLDSIPTTIPPTAKPKPGNARTGRKFPAEILTRDEINRLLNCCSSSAPTAIRNQALLVMLWRGGLRISEALALMPKDLDRTAGTVRILHGKGNKARTIGLDAQAFAVLQRWMDARAALGINGRAPLFCTLGGGPVLSSYVRSSLLPRLARQAGITKRVHPHGMRHTCAAELAREGKPVNLIQRQLGHGSLSTTSIYLNHISPVDLIASMQQRTWMAAEHNG